MIRAEVGTQFRSFNCSLSVKPGHPWPYCLPVAVREYERFGLTGESDDHIVVPGVGTARPTLADQTKYEFEQPRRIEFHSVAGPGVLGCFRGDCVSAQLLVIEHYFDVGGADVNGIDEHLVANELKVNGSVAGPHRVEVAEVHATEFAENAVSVSYRDRLRPAEDRGEDVPVCVQSPLS